MERLDEVPGDRPVVVYCARGQRSTTGVSLLERAGFSPVLNIDGRLDALREAGFVAAR